MARRNKKTIKQSYEEMFALAALNNPTYKGIRKVEKLVTKGMSAKAWIKNHGKSSTESTTKKPNE